MRALLAAAAVVAGLLPGAAAASPPDLFGLGAPSMGRGTAGLVLDADGFAAWRNPAALGLATSARADLGLHFGTMKFRCFDEPVSLNPTVCPLVILADGNRDGVVDPDNPFDRWHPEEDDYPAPNGTRLGIVIPWRQWFRLGVSLSLPAGRILRIDQVDPQLPYYIRFKNRPQRLSLHVGASIRIIDGLYIGASAAILARSTLHLDFTVDARVTDEELADADELDVDFVVNPYAIEADVKPYVAPVASVLWDLGTLTPKLDGLRVAAVYRHPIDLKVEPTTLGLGLFGVVDDVGSFGDVLVPLQTNVLFSILDFSTPRQVAVGVGWERPRFAAAVDVTWQQWSTILPNVARVDAEGTDIEIGLIGLDPVVVGARDYEPLQFQDTVSVAIGGELRPPPAPLTGKVGSKFKELGLVVRAGYRFEPTFVPEQTGLTSFLDNPTHLVSAGVGVWTWEPFGLTGGTFGLDLFAQLQVLEPRLHTKDPTLDDEAPPAGWPIGGTVDSGGIVFLAGGDISVRFGGP
ncbi:MAG: hypothetical protein GY898_24415 [Proteobacteria bacterium]|nr:hypothetical protein [Pseudomonadota bacterium]